MYHTDVLLLLLYNITYFTMVWCISQYCRIIYFEITYTIMYCKLYYYVKRDYILLLCIVMKSKIKHFTLLYCTIWQNCIILYYNGFFYLYTALLCHTFIIALLLYCNVFYSYDTNVSITHRANISIRLIRFIITGILCYNTESCI